MTLSRNVLIVVAHPEPASFNHALANTAAAALRGVGHNVTISDLAADGFRADLGRHDMESVANPNQFHVQAEQANAARLQGFAEDVEREQGRVANADIVILQFPLWWGGPPALLKGWIDRVLSYGFAYVDGRRFETGLFQGRRAMLSVTTGGTPARFSEDGVFGPIGPLLMPIQRLALEYTGFTVCEPNVCYGVPRTDADQRKTYLNQFADKTLSLASLPVSPTNAWKTALDKVPEGAWSRKT